MITPLIKLNTESGKELYKVFGWCFSRVSVCFIYRYVFVLGMVRSSLQKPS